MDSEHVKELVNKLNDDISGLKEALEPLTKTNLNDTASKLPVLDRAKLFTFAAYSIESILFSNLRLHGVDAKKHPIFAELARVRQYFDKIRTAELGDQQGPSLRIDKAAVGRILKHELAANNRSSASSPQGTKRKFTDSENTPVTNNSEAEGTSAGPSPSKMRSGDEVEADFVTLDEQTKSTKKAKKAAKRKSKEKKKDAKQ